MIILSITRNLDQYQKTLDYFRRHYDESVRYIIIPPIEARGEVLMQDSRIESPDTSERGIQETLYDVFVSIPDGEKILILPETRVFSERLPLVGGGKELVFYEEEGGNWGARLIKGKSFFPTGRRSVDWMNFGDIQREQIDFSINFPRLESMQKKAAVPRILIFGAENVYLKSNPEPGSFESDELEVYSYYSSKNASKLIAELDPDCIITVGESVNLFREVLFQPSWIRMRWMHVESIEPNLGDAAYFQSMMSMIEGKKEYPLISIITPIRNIGEKLRSTYSSVAAQTWWNWEWILVNDGDDKLTGTIAQELAAIEPRIKYYDIHPRSNSRVGEAKYRGFSLSDGDYLVELDHDDMLAPEAIELAALAFEKYPDAGFCYSNYAEVDVNFNDLNYGGSSFAYGYGLYSSFFYKGIEHTEQSTPHINPISIRSNVAMPNHFRAWTREAYFKAGGHNRRLSVMDDLDLVIRTFLVTKIVKVDWMCYWQFYFGLNYDSQSSYTNTQNLVRMDIQRRARTISQFYNEKIKSRFEELGKHDWAFERNPGDPRRVDPIYGEGENRVNYVLDRETIEMRLYNRGLKSIYQQN
jgi:glycosyltransferase involved in cell wall biosynthesis